MEIYTRDTVHAVAGCIVQLGGQTTLGLAQKIADPACRRRHHPEATPARTAASRRGPELRPDGPCLRHRHILRGGRARPTRSGPGLVAPPKSGTARHGVSREDRWTTKSSAPRAVPVTGIVDDSWTPHEIESALAAAGRRPAGVWSKSRRPQHPVTKRVPPPRPGAEDNEKVRRSTEALATASVSRA